MRHKITAKFGPIVVEFRPAGEGDIMAELYGGRRHESLWASMVSLMAGDYLTARQKVVRSLFLLIAFALMALPWVIDLLLH
jgi:hypothetical protein